MENADFLPTDLGECLRLLLAAFQQTVQLERRVCNAEQRATELQQRTAASDQQAAELNRVLDATSDSFRELQEQHSATLEELAWYKRWVHGRRGEWVVEADGQQHLFDLTPGSDAEPPTAPESTESLQQVTGHTRRRRRELDLSRLPHHRHEQDLPPEQKICSGCGRDKDRIGEDVTKILEHVPAKLEVHEHARPKYACRYCKDGVCSPPPPERPIARGIAGRRWRFVSHAADGPKQRSAPESCSRRHKPALPDGADRSDRRQQVWRSPAAVSPGSNRGRRPVREEEGRGR